MNAELKAQLNKDFEGFEAEGEYRIAPMMRYVASLNPSASIHEFVEIATARGYNPATAGIQLRQSRRQDCADFGHMTDPEWRLIMRDEVVEV